MERHVVGTLLLIMLSIVPNYCINKERSQQKSTKADLNANIYDFFGDYHLSQEDPIGLEWRAFILLKEKFLKKPVNYVAAPWLVLAKRNQLGEVAKLRLNGGFTVCDCLTGVIGERTLKVLKQIGIDCVFSPCATISRQVIDGIRIEPFPYYAVNSADPSATKNILYSFIGYCSHPIRNKIFTIAHLPQTVIKRRSTFHYFFNQSQLAAMQSEYTQNLAESRFSLCPRGNEPNSIRFWESLRAGAVPILIADDARLPDWFDWNSCIIRVQEKDILKIPEIVKKITSDQEERMRQKCLEAYSLFSGENYVSTIRHYYEKE